jgi:hypothetical protein
MARRIIAILSLGVLLAAGMVTSASAATSVAPNCGITWGSLPKTAVGTASPIVNARTGQHLCYDRFVVDLKGSSAAGYDVGYVTNVVTQGQGAVIPLAGGAKLSVVVRAPAYDPNTGKSTYPAVGAKLPGVNLTGYRTFRDAKFGGSFEGYTTFGLGVRAKLPFRVTRLSSPGRVVVDVAHRWS